MIHTQSPPQSNLLPEQNKIPAVDTNSQDATAGTKHADAEGKIQPGKISLPDTSGNVKS